MNIRSTLTCLFPDGFVIDCSHFQAGALEVHGLPRGTVPQNCEVLASGRPKFSLGHGHQEILLVKTDEYIVLLRISPAGPHNHDGEFVVSRGYAAVDGAQSLAFQTSARKTIQDLCGAALTPPARLNH